MAEPGATVVAERRPLRSRRQALRRRTALGGRPALGRRPVEVPRPAPGRGPLLGPGPVAETFPEPLSSLEQDLWVPPLRDGIVEALRITGAAGRRALRRSPVVTVVGGRVVADLELLGHGPRRRRRLLARLDPRPPARRLGAAWRVGRMKVAFAGLAGDLITRTDQELERMPGLVLLDDLTLLRALDRSRLLLRALHAHEVLAGLLLPTGEATAASAGLRALAAARASGLTDADALARDPVILALVPPAVGAPHPLPPIHAGLAAGASAAVPGTGAAELREALRLRARWTQELSARMALELGARATERGALPAPEAVRHLTLAELEAVLLGRLLLPDFRARVEGAAAAPLPAAFRLAAGGDVVAETAAAADAGQGVAPGTGTGPVHTGSDWPPDGAVLVVPALDPRLASLLPGLAAVVSETGTELSHVAIVARELGVPVVVGIAGAPQRYEPGTLVEVDGTAGTVRPAAAGTVHGAAQR